MLKNFLYALVINNFEGIRVNDDQTIFNFADEISRDITALGHHLVQIRAYC